MGRMEEVQLMKGVMQEAGRGVHGVRVVVLLDLVHGPTGKLLLSSVLVNVMSILIKIGNMEIITCL